MHQYPDIKRAFKLSCKLTMRRLYLPKGFNCVESPVISIQRHLNVLNDMLVKRTRICG